MKKFSRPLWIGVLMLVFWTSACNLSRPTPAAPLGTVLPNGQLATPTVTGLISVTETSTPLTPVIPITGENVVQMQCQFCVNGFAHAVFVFPDFAIFDVETSSPVTCLTAEVVNGKRVLVCHGTQSTSFNLKICSDNSNCLLFPVALEPCPLAGAGAPITTGTEITPVFLTPINTLLPPSSTPKPKNPAASQAPTQTNVVPPVATSTIAPPPLSTSTPIPSTPVPPPASTSTSAPPPPATSTSAPPPPPEATSTSAPAPTQPADTSAPTAAPSESNQKLTHTAKP